MDDPAHRDEVSRLREQLSDAKARRAALLEEIMHLAARLPETRRQFGNPFYYSHPKEPDEGIANYNPNPGAETGWQTWRSLRRVEKELVQITDALWRLGEFVLPE